MVILLEINFLTQSLVFYPLAFLYYLKITFSMYHKFKFCKTQVSVSLRISNYHALQVVCLRNPLAQHTAPS